MEKNDSPNAPPQKSPSEVLLLGPTLGVDLGSNHIRIGTVATDGKLTSFVREPYTEQAKADPRRLSDHLLAVLQQVLREHAGIRAIGVAFPGIIDQPRQAVVQLSQLPALGQIDFHKELSQAFGLPVHFESNANAAACCERVFGAAQGVDNLLYLHIGANVSVGLLLNGVLHRGASGLAGALGQVRIYSEHVGESIPLETMASAESIVRRTQERLHRDKTSSLSRLGAMGGFTYDDIIEAAHGGDDLAKIMLERTGLYIGIALADVVSLLNLSLITVGGAPAGRNFLVPAIAEEVERRVSPMAFADCRILAAEIGAEAGVIGAALLAGSRQ